MYLCKIADLMLISLDIQIFTKFDKINQVVLQVGCSVKTTKHMSIYLFIHKLTQFEEVN